MTMPGINAELEGTWKQGTKDPSRLGDGWERRGVSEPHINFNLKKQVAVGLAEMWKDEG